MKPEQTTVFFALLAVMNVALAGCSSHPMPENDEKMVWIVNSPLTVEQDEYQCFMVMISGRNAEPRSVVCILPQTDGTSKDCMMATVMDGSLTVGFWRDKTMHLTDGDWDTVFLLRQKTSDVERSDPIRFRTTYGELEIPMEKRFLPEMQPILEKLIRENLPKNE